MRQLAALPRDNDLRRATLGGYSRDAFRAHPENNLVALSPTHAERNVHPADGHRRSTRHRDSLQQRAIGGPIGDRLAVRRKNRIRHAAARERSGNRDRRRVADPLDKQAGFGNIRQARSVRRNRDHLPVRIGELVAFGQRHMLRFRRQVRRHRHDGACQQRGDQWFHKSSKPILQAIRADHKDQGLPRALRRRWA